MNRSFGTAEYPVLTAANGERVIISGHPAENGIFQGFMRAAGREPLSLALMDARNHTLGLLGLLDAQEPEGAAADPPGSAHLALAGFSFGAFVTCQAIAALAPTRPIEKIVLVGTATEPVLPSVA